MGTWLDSGKLKQYKQKYNIHSIKYEY